MTDAADFQPAELELHRDFLRRLARALVRGEGAAEDLVQESFARALEHPPRSGATLRVWLGTVLRRLAQDRVRAESRAGARERRVARPDSVPPPEEALASLELQERVIAAVKGLDEPYRTTLWLRYHEDLSAREIAAREEASPKTIESRLTRGLALLRKELDRQSGGDREAWFQALLLWQAPPPTASLLPLLIGSTLMKTLAVAAVLALILFFGLRLRSAQGPDAPLTRARTEPAVAQLPAAAPALPEREALAETEPPTTSARARETELLVRVRWADDGSPAPDVGLVLHPEDDPLGPRAIQCLWSDAAGLARGAALHPGRVRVEADRGGQCTVTLAEGEVREVVLELAGPLELEGTVSDAAGLPIASAEVLLVADALDWLAPRVVAHTAANGTYRVRAVEAEFSLSARSAEHAPAPLRSLRGRSGRTRNDFVLDRQGISLRGIVRDPHGAPVAGARVAVGDPRGYAEQNPEQPGTWLQTRGLRVETTDAEGRFFAAHVPELIGVTVAVQAAGYPLALASASAGIGQTAFVELTLEPPATLVGVVRGPGEKPAAGVRVAAVRLGDARNEIPFALPDGKSDAEGRVRLELLPPGPVTLRLDPSGDSSGYTLVSLVLAAGETSHDLDLAVDDAIRGRVLVPPGTALDGWQVTAHELLGVSRIQRAPVAPDGSFVLADCGRPPYRLELYAAAHRPVLRRDDAGPGPELLLVLEPLGSLAGEFVDEAGLLPAGAHPEAVVEREFASEPPSWDAAGLFVFEDLRPGRYQLRLEHEQRLLYSRWVEIRPGQRLDLGRIVSAAPGSLVVEHLTAGSVATGSVLDADYGFHAGLEPVDGELGLEELAPGEWFLELAAQGFAPLLVPFSVRSGARTRLELTFEPAVQRSLAFAVHGQDWNWMRITLQESHGRRFLARWLERSSMPQPSRGPSLVLELPVGTFEVEAETDTGLALRAGFDVTALEPQDSALVFELR